MKRTKQDYLNLLEETINFYSEDTSRRAVEYGECQYLTKEGKMCAVGRCLNPDKMDYKRFNNDTDVISLVEGLTDNVFLEEYRGCHVRFWQELQALHDNERNWDKDGLTLIGRTKYDEIVDDIENGEFTK